ncbi:MAG: lysoplasmalogenase [Saprospiraceae bacterium]|nr:lysoplasmalogenase [Pyrinomonadaceae bacterium]
MNYDKAIIVIGSICMANAVLYVIAEWRNWQTARGLSKFVASTAFVVLAVQNGAAGSIYGRLILLALIFSWVGDALLLSLRSTFLLTGMAAFFLAHAAFAAAFASLPLETTWLTIALVILTTGALAILSWLWKYLEPFYKIAVPVYLTAITVMTSLAIAASSASPLLATGALIFVVSDISVARNRFVERNVVNKIWGMPLYYAAQLLFAMSVLSHG